MKKLLIINIVALLSIVFIAATSYAKTTNSSKTPTVNVLQWWGYISSTDPYIKQIEQNCHTQISYDQYYSNGEFLLRIRDNTYHYDIIIFSNTIFKAIQNEIADDNSTLYKLSENYYPIIRERYKQYGFPRNVVFFIHSLTGFLYNPEVISLNSKDNIFDMFKKARGKTVVMLDDPVEAEFLLSLGIRESTHSKARLMQKLDMIPLTIDNFKKLYNGTNFIITNLPERISTKPNFAFAYQWSGDAIEMIKNSNKKLKFFIHPRLSYVTSDLLATLNNNKATMCVAKALGSKWFLQHEQNKTFYFSPYADSKNITDPYFKQIFDNWKKDLPILPWIISADHKQFETLVNKWDLIKLEVAEQPHGASS